MKQNYAGSHADHRGAAAGPSVNEDHDCQRPEPTVDTPHLTHSWGPLDGYDWADAPDIMLGKGPPDGGEP